MCCTRCKFTHERCCQACSRAQRRGQQPSQLCVPQKSARAKNKTVSVRACMHVGTSRFSFSPARESKISTWLDSVDQHSRRVHFCLQATCTSWASSVMHDRLDSGASPSAQASTSRTLVCAGSCVPAWATSSDGTAVCDMFVGGSAARNGWDGWPWRGLGLARAGLIEAMPTYKGDDGLSEAERIAYAVCNPVLSYPVLSKLPASAIASGADQALRSGLL